MRSPDVIEAPFGSVVLALDSPDFSVEYPELHGRELIPVGWLKAMEATWTVGRFENRKVDFHRLRDVFVAFDGVVFDKDGNVLSPGASGHTQGEMEQAAGWLRDAMRRGSIAVHLGTSVLCKKRGAMNYGHFLVEMLPMALLARKHLPTAPRRFLVPDEKGALGAVITDACRMIGLEDREIVRIGHHPVFCEEVIVIDGLTHHGRFMSPLVFEGLDRLASCVEAEPAERIYVSRKSANYRKLCNEAELEPVFRYNGYRIVDPGTMPLRSQIALFKGARSIIGVDGAAMTNICFSPPGASVTCLTPATMPETFYWFLCTHRRHRFRDVRLPEVGSPPPNHRSWCADVSIDPGELERWLRA